MTAISTTPYIILRHVKIDIAVKLKLNTKKLLILIKNKCEIITIRPILVTIIVILKSTSR